MKYAAALLTGDPKRTWNRQYDPGALPANYTWKNFMTFLMDCVEDPVSRSTSAMYEFNIAAQKPGQTVGGFAAELATIEDPLKPFPESLRVSLLLSKLHLYLQDAIPLQSPLPTTRNELIALATRLERVESRKRPAPRDPKDFAPRTLKNRRSEPFKKRQEARKTGGATDLTPRQGQEVSTTSVDKSKITC